MNFYIVYAIDKKGKKVFDGFEADDITKLHKIVQNNDYVPLKIYTIDERFSFLKLLFIPKISTDQAIEILDNLNIVLKAGIPLTDGLKDIKDDASNENVKKLITRISNDVANGMKLSSATKPFENYFTPTIINLMAIGEETGQLSQTLLNGADFLRKTQTLKKNTKKALFTPLISLVLIFLAVVAWMTFVVPGMVDFFKDMDTELPALTVFLIDASAFTTEYISVILLGIFIFVVLFRLLYRYIRSFRVFILNIALRVPLFSQMVKFFNIAFIMEYLQLSITSGLTLYESLKMLTKSIENDIYKNDIIRIIEQLEKGERFSEQTTDRTLYTNYVTRVLQIGEDTSSMDSELKNIATTYYEKVDDLSAMIPKVVQPITMLIGGGFMAVIMMGLMGPIYDLIGKM